MSIDTSPVMDRLSSRHVNEMNFGLGSWLCRNVGARLAGGTIFPQIANGAANVPKTSGFELAEETRIPLRERPFGVFTRPGSL
jgi:hypothetical protein